MFDPPRARVARRDADRRGAVLIGPADRVRGVRLGHQPVVAVGMGREDQRAVMHRGKAPGDGLFQHLRPVMPAIVEDVFAVGVDDREMGVQPIAGIVGIGLGHETGGKAVAAGQTLDQHLEEPGIIGGAQRVVGVHQIDLELAQAGFGDCRVGGNIHRLAGVIEVGKEGVEGIQRADRHDLCRLAPLARARRERHLKLFPAVVDQEEFQFHRADRRQPARLVAADDAGQRVTGVAVIGLAVFAKHPDRQKRCRRVEPGHRHEATLGRFQHAIGIAAVEDKGAVLDILAPDVEIEDGHRKPGSVLHHRVRETDGNTFAARLAVEVGGCHTDGTHLRVLSKPVLHFLTWCRGWSETAPAGQRRHRQSRPMPLGHLRLIISAVRGIPPVQLTGI